MYVCMWDKEMLSEERNREKGEGFGLQVKPRSKAFKPRSVEICFELASIRTQIKWFWTHIWFVLASIWFIMLRSSFVPIFAASFLFSLSNIRAPTKILTKTATVYAGKPTLGALDQHWSKQNDPQQFGDESAQISSWFVFVIVFYWVFLEFLDLGSIGVFGFIC